MAPPGQAAAGNGQLVEHEARDRGEQQGFAGGWIVADPSFIDFFPEYFGQPFEQGFRGDVLGAGRQQDSMQDQALRT